MIDIELEQAVYDYNKILEEGFATRPICFVEGNNRFFYQKIEELFPFDISNGGSCYEIIKRIKHDEKNIGIIDKDYRFDEITYDNILIIDYYSIENIALKVVPDYQILRDKITEEIDNFGLDSFLTCNIRVKFNTRERYNLDLNIELADSYSENDRIRYVTQRITTIEQFFKYKNFKKAVEGTNKYLKMKKQKKIEYINGLHSYFDKPIFREILSEIEYSRFLEINDRVLNI